MNNEAPVQQLQSEVSIATPTERELLISKLRTDEKFKPKGAIAFFVLLMILCAAIWYGVYALELSRQ